MLISSQTCLTKNYISSTAMTTITLDLLHLCNCAVLFLWNHQTNCSTNYCLAEKTFIWKRQMWVRVADFLWYDKSGGSHFCKLPDL